MLNPSDLVFPEGMLSLAMYRGSTKEEFVQALQVYVTAAQKAVVKRVGQVAYNASTDEQRETWLEAERHYAMHLAFTQLCLLSSTLPSFATEVNISATYGGSGNLRQLASAALEMFNALVPLPAVTAPAEDEYSDDSEVIAEF